MNVRKTCVIFKKIELASCKLDLTYVLFLSCVFCGLQSFGSEYKTRGRIKVSMNLEYMPFVTIFLRYVTEKFIQFPFK